MTQQTTTKPDKTTTTTQITTTKQKQHRQQPQHKIIQQIKSLLFNKKNYLTIILKIYFILLYTKYFYCKRFCSCRMSLCSIVYQIILLLPVL